MGTTVGMLGAGIVASNAHAAIVQRPDLDQTVELTPIGSPIASANQAVFVDLVAGNGVGDDFGISFNLTGDLVSESSLGFSFLGITRLFALLADSITGGPRLLGAGEEIALPLTLSPNQFRTDIFLTDMPGAGEPPLPAGEKSFVLFGFEDFNNRVPQVLYGYFGFTFERIDGPGNEVTGRFTLSDFAYDDDPNASSIVVVPEPASLSVLAAGLMLAGGRRRKG